MSLTDAIRPREGQRYRFKNQIFYAIEGLVAIEDRNTGAYRALKLHECKERIIAMYEEASVMEYKDERDEFLKAVVDLKAARDEAIKQGNPFDPRIARQKQREGRRILTTVSCPNRILHRNRSRHVSHFLNVGSSIDVNALPVAEPIQSDAGAVLLHTARYRNFSI